jgi:hypothetical protein
LARNDAPAARRHCEEQRDDPSPLAAQAPQGRQSAEALQREGRKQSRAKERNGESNFRVRNCRIIHLKSLDHFGLLGVFLFATLWSLQSNTEEELG